MRISKYFIIAAIISFLIPSALSANVDTFHFELDFGAAQSYYFGFSEDEMLNEDMIPTPLDGSFDFGDTLLDENGNVYAEMDIFVYWRMVSTEGAILRISGTPLSNGADTIGWAMKKTKATGDGNDSLDDGFESETGWTVVEKPGALIHENNKSTTCWGSIRFHCETDHVDKTGSYRGTITLTLEKI